MCRRVRERQQAGTAGGSDEIHRIIPLGLKTQEAGGWYLHDVLNRWLFKGLLSLGVAVTITLSMLTPLNEYLESTLTLHMVAQHFLFITAGFLFAYGIDSLILVASRASRRVSKAYTVLLKVNSSLNKKGMVTFVIAALLTAYWHFPSNFDAAVLSESVHIEMHLTFLAVGGLVFVGAKMLTQRMRYIAPIIVGKAMGLYGAFLLFTPMYVYPVYEASEQAEAGLVMVVMMLVMDLTIVPVWLYNYFGKAFPTSPASYFGKPKCGIGYGVVFENE